MELTPVHWKKLRVAKSFLQRRVEQVWVIVDATVDVLLNDEVAPMSEDQHHNNAMKTLVDCIPCGLKSGLSLLCTDADDGSAGCRSLKMTT